MDRSEWESIRDEFRRLARREGITNIAREIPADRRTVYRLIDGPTQTPSRAVFAGIERLVNERKENPEP
jgi:hypothetical protein